MPSGEQIQSELRARKFYSKFDFSSGFWQIPLAEESKDLTAVTTHRGLFRFKVMPFGLVNAPATFNRAMRKLLVDMQSIYSYLDDVVTGTIEWTDHLKILREFFSRVRAANLVLRPAKCQVGFATVDYLGFRIGEGLVDNQPKKVEEVLKVS